ncbi:sigma-70 family RNA polymerase sigma factor [Psychroflexus sp. YR1-1]|uniref:Sigma-70 family RNA polymerase sigma factor n=1 Tax=Psychroflexus aurantiacus TaxID=2709310 RepID=A0A6B3R392_9FLAO|nr:sigma-70 family RNA polymerase sigma factor [Psychroflexus aurantiacus]NEV93265.1 sigma-70 family RNA polymerase sigma factor [Psychroflexus aurantiacus]
MAVKPDVTALINKAKQADQKAFRALLNHFWEDVYRFQLKRTNDTYEAEEITVQTFARAFDRIETYEESFKFKTWLMTISKNIHIDLTRKQRLKTSEIDSRKVSQIADAEPTVEDKIINEQNLSNLLRQIKELQPHYREVIELRFFKEMSYKEIAVRTEQPITNVKVRLLRAKKLLAEIINQKQK